MPKGWKPHQVHAGDEFGSLTVTGFSHSDKRWRRHYSVKCKCGVEKTVQGTLLRSGNTKSCGCLVKEAASKRVKPNNHAAITTIILQYKRHARDRSIDWGLTRKEVSSICHKPCHYCGEVAGNTFRNKSLPDGFKYNGIDRANNADGYHSNNVVPCCGQCNSAKGTLSQAEFIAWAKAIATQWGPLMTPTPEPAAHPSARSSRPLAVRATAPVERIAPGAFYSEVTV